MEKVITGAIKAEYIEVEPNVRLHITDAGKGRPNLPQSAVDDLI